MWGWVVAIVVVVVVWAVGGAIANGMGAGPFLPGGCDGCKVLHSWWAGLSFWQHIIFGGWYGWKLIFCATSC